MCIYVHTRVTSNSVFRMHNDIHAYTHTYLITMISYVWIKIQKYMYLCIYVDIHMYTCIDVDVSASDKGGLGSKFKISTKILLYIPSLNGVTVDRITTRATLTVTPMLYHDYPHLSPCQTLTKPKLITSPFAQRNGHGLLQHLRVQKCFDVIRCHAINYSMLRES